MSEDGDSIDEVSTDDKTNKRSPRNIQTVPMAVTGSRRFKPREGQPTNIEPENRNYPSKKLVRSWALR